MNENAIDPYDAELLQLISKLEGRLHPKTISFAKELVEHGEYTVCLEAIISGLRSKGGPVPAEILNKIIEESASWGIKEDLYKVLKPE
ncbi:MafI family immunity protein [Rathayibacter toxicus]|uniref:MafI family immunity protein n=1 Tax=Rathayibacter toxicus TaxID=145458 RepID=UPI001C03E73A|nr:MafI family immunity protein [Rathayibacter toxicus]QWL33229.1 MafI family immunity protein [Rathayibacter toxicus]QWL35324.1 MafI family immunity protein [Rathayibacter toxicus]QWL37455.1 MafI family immunity protein [Rathayibacter toxicus]QWL39548.1 MafI family immunity protein [Rathayibacter toxicus]QWL41631.1 MafI family immunity protein [Rathayibacter toxicus]